MEIGDKYIVTGGMNVSKWHEGIKTVAEYSQSGFVKYLTPMIIGKRSHACSKFVTADGDTVRNCYLNNYIHVLICVLQALMVIGGNGGYTEMMVNSKWSIVATPPPRYYWTAATLANSVSVFGK